MTVVLQPKPVAESMRATIRAAVQEFQHELGELEYLPRLRYDRGVFPTLGQYDWGSGQVLYSLVRHVRPKVIIEFSTSSGYSTTFTAAALARNGRGVLHSVDLDATALAAAGQWLSNQRLDRVVNLHLGDCRNIVPRLLRHDVDLLFVDSLHSFDIANWYLGAIVPKLRPDVLVHVHDVMPPEACVRIHGGPPYDPAPPAAGPPPKFLLKRAVWLALHARWPNPFPARSPREMLPLERLAVHPPRGPEELPTIDGNYFEEAVLIRELLRGSDPDELVYLNRVMDQLPVLSPQEFAAPAVAQRADARGRSFEWNDVLWCRAGPLAELCDRDRMARLTRTLRREFYGDRSLRLFSGDA